MKHLLITIGIIIGLTTISYSQTQKIGFVDLQIVIRDSKAGQSARSSFETAFKSKRDIIEQKTRALEQMKQDFIKNSPVMNDSTRKQKAELIDKKEKELNRTREDFREELQKKDLELTQKILKDIESILRQIGQSEGFDIIFERTEAGIIYAGPSADITNKVIQAYDSKR